MSKLTLIEAAKLKGQGKKGKKIVPQQQTSSLVNLKVKGRSKK